MSVPDFTGRHELFLGFWGFLCGLYDRKRNERKRSKKQECAFLKKGAPKTFVRFPPGDVGTSRVKVAEIFCGAFFKKATAYFVDSGRDEQVVDAGLRRHDEFETGGG